AEGLRLLQAGADVCVAAGAPTADLQWQLRALVRLRQRFDRLTAEKKELEELSRQDALTGLLNRRSLEERIAEEFRRAQRHGDALCVLMLDLDEFKRINDRRGHPFGDRVLRGVAKRIAESVRETDFCARYGGEEFSVILPRTSLNGALTVAERIRTSVEREGLDGEQVTVSIGVAGLPGASSASPELLVRAADEALYVAKREGRNRTKIYRDGPRRGAAA
ncbi:MAG: GGDEF domain-containing protein, partial [Deltaproteobacteria bacterium]